MQRDAERRADVARGKRIGERDARRLAGRLAIAAAGEEASEAADDMPQCNPGREDVARRPKRQTRAPDVAERDHHCENEAAVEHAPDAHQRQELARVGRERLEVDDEEQQFRADERADDDVDAEIEDAIAVDFKSDRKSTRLNSSHTVISYAVFCLKKKT